MSADLSKITPSVSNEVVLREQTTESSSTDSFNDPLTPLDFAAELNQCYYSEENVCDDDADEDTNVKRLNQLATQALASRNYARNSLMQSKLQKLTISSIDIYNTTVQSPETPEYQDSISNSDVVMPINQLRLGLSQVSDHSTSTGSVFNVARVKKIELQDLSLIKGLEAGKRI